MSDVDQTEFQQEVLKQLKFIEQHLSSMHAQSKQQTDILRSLNANMALNAKSGSSYGR